jgi:hypothetical protein
LLYREAQRITSDTSSGAYFSGKADKKVKNALKKGKFGQDYYLL